MAKPPYSAKVTMWTPTMKADTSGGAIGCMRFMFDMLPLDKQERVLHLLNEAHNDEKQRKSTPAV